jgi:ELWxxDGT repeat protein
VAESADVLPDVTAEKSELDSALRLFDDARRRQKIHDAEKRKATQDMRTALGRSKDAARQVRLGAQQSNLSPSAAYTARTRPQPRRDRMTMSAAKSWSALLLLCLLLLPQAAAAGDLVPHPVRDLDLTTYTASSSPRQMAQLHDGFTFTAFGNRQLWAYDAVVGQFEPVLGLEGGEIRQLAGAVYAQNGTGGWRIWKADVLGPSSAVTLQPIARLGRVYAGAGGDPSLLFFEGGNGGNGGGATGLWAVDEYHHRPVEIARPLPGPDGALLHDLRVYRGTAYFVARDRTRGTALWVSNRTRAGTFPVFTPAPGAAAAMLFPGIVRHRMLLAVSGESPALWLSDGTAHGTRKLVEIGLSGAGAGITDAVQIPATERVFFVAGDGRTGKQLWVTDGTAGGTRRLTRFTAAEPFAGSPLSTATLGGRLAFFADDGVHGRELWWSDGTPGGTRRLADFCPGACGTEGEILAALPAAAGSRQPERLLVSAPAPDGGGRELWSVDGSGAGPAFLGDLCPGACSADPQGFVTGDFAGITFTAATPDGGRALWFTDGTPQRTWRLTPPGATVTSVRPLAVSDAEFGDELWTTDGTPAGTHLWADVGWEVDSGSHPVFLGTLGDRAVFAAYTPAHGSRLYTSDGTAAGTLRLDRTIPALLDGWSGTAAGGHALFDVPLHGDWTTFALWSTDGKDAVRLTAAEVTAGPFPAGDQAVFFAEDREHGAEPWVTGGTPESTHPIADLSPGGTSSSDGTGARIFHGQVLFNRFDAPAHWITDGTAEGTRRLIDLYPFLAPADNLAEPQLAEVAGKLYFTGTEGPASPLEVWVSDWTAAGTHPLGFPPEGLRVDALQAAGSRLFLYVRQTFVGPPLDPSPLWVLDPAAETVTPVPVPGRGDVLGALPPTAFGDRLVFSDSEQRLAVTDGTPAGTFLLRIPSGQTVDVVASRAVSFAGHLLIGGSPALDPPHGFGACYVWDGTGATVERLDGFLANGDFFPAGSQLYFTGFAPGTGAEPWVFDSATGAGTGEGAFPSRASPSSV